jgi:hypothetical protein
MRVYGGAVRPATLFPIVITRLVGRCLPVPFRCAPQWPSRNHKRRGCNDPLGLRTIAPVQRISGETFQAGSSVQTIVKCIVWAIGIGSVLSLQPMFDHLNDPVDHSPVINSRHTMLERKKRDIRANRRSLGNYRSDMVADLRYVRNHRKRVNARISDS